VSEVGDSSDVSHVHLPQMQLVVTGFAMLVTRMHWARIQLTPDDNVVWVKDGWFLDLLDGDFVGSLVDNCSHASHSSS
jgi:hypothetical protein